MNLKVCFMRIKCLFFVIQIFSSLVNVLADHLRLDNVTDKDLIEMDFQKSLLISKNVTKILDQLLKGYDKRLRPNYAGLPVVIGITININNINSVSEVNMDYTIDMYIRQLWTDKRLSFNGINELVIGSDMLHKIWLPDTFLANDRKSYFHKATVQNKFIRINPDGQVLFSMRLTVTASCPMNFRYFPMDHQECDLEIESYGFRMEDIQYKWAAGLNKSALDLASGIQLPQLKYKDFELIERKVKLSTGTYSRLTMKLYFVRSLGYYITQIYIPSTLIVVLSWVSFWLDRTHAPARVSLGITTVLTMVTFIWSTNASLPKISYVKGIDVYLVCCFIMTFASVIEYGMVSYIHRRREKAKKRLNDELQTAQQQHALQQQLLAIRANSVALYNSNTNLQNKFSKDFSGNDFELENMIPAYSRSQRHSQAEILHPIDHNHLHSHHQLHSSHQHHQHGNNHHSSGGSGGGGGNHYIQDKDSRLIWERKLVAANEMSSDYERTNSLEDEYATSNNNAANMNTMSQCQNPSNMKMVPIIYEKQKSCTCNSSSMHGPAGSSMRQTDNNMNMNMNMNNNPSSSVYGSRKQSPVHHASSCKATAAAHASSNGLSGNNKCRLCGSKSFININNNESIELTGRQGDREMITLNDRMNRLSQIDLARSSTSLHVNPNKPLPVYPIVPTNPIKLSSINLQTIRQKSHWYDFNVKACTIDNYSRVIFPVTFFGFHIIYWTTYLKISATMSRK